jgi:hypothetical protein
VAVTLKRLPTGEEMAAKMQRNLANSGTAWKDGMRHPRKDPLAEAKKSSAKWKAKVIEAANNDSFAKGLGKVNEAEMAAAVDATPDSAVADGVTRRMAKTTRRLSELAGHLATNVAEIDGMPNTTEADAAARMIKNLANMRGIGKKMRGG